MTKKMKTPKTIKDRLEYLRGEIEAERISYGEISELQSLAEYIEPDDVLLLQWAGVPEFPDKETADLWKKNEVQFPRLIAEAEAAGAFTPSVLCDMADSMDLELKQVRELIDRGQEAWEQVKDKYCR